MKFNNLIELAKAVSNDILQVELKIKKKIPIDMNLDMNIDLLPKDDNGDMAREDPEEFIRLLNNSLAIRLNYMYEEGFLAKEDGYYRYYTSKELKKMLDDIGADDID
jgi:hypothetical protein